MRNKIHTMVFLASVSFALSGCISTFVPTKKGPIGGPSKTMYLDSGWICANIKNVTASGETLSLRSYSMTGWIPATVPGTVLTTLLNDDLVPDPFYGLNDERIPDIYETGPDYYTYWFVNDFFQKPPVDNGQVWLHFRGVNYGCDVFLNGHKLNEKTHHGMFLRQAYDISGFLSADGQNRLAVIVYPPDPVGNPDGGQGGDGTIARNVCNQYVTGWDWIQPVRDRNTGIWDKVWIEETKGVAIRNPFVVTLVPGKRYPGERQAPAIIKASAEIVNPLDKIINGTAEYVLDGNTVSKEVVLQPKSTTTIQFPLFTLENPKLWWPNGYGPQNLYKISFEFLNDDGEPLDRKEITIGVREIETRWDRHTRSREVLVNGQRIFIKGGDWIASDAMLRLSANRYDAEVRFHRDMNLNLIRVWGGSITERPEFYDACDKYGILVFQDFWISGDCNGKWTDPSKKDDQWIRRQYPDDHSLFLASVADQVKMLRDHPSLAFYCGGNEMPPPKDILLAMQDSLLPALDSSRYFFSYSNVDSMSFNSIGYTGDGPYFIQPYANFWDNRFFPFNSEIGSIGLGDYQSLERFIPPEDMVLPGSTWTQVDSVWKYHKPSWYGKFIDAYGKPTDVKDYADKAQLVNYDEYRALMEGHLSHMWDWYTGLIIWKTQNPWTAMRGQMYDYYLDPNAGLYGLHHAGEPLHVMCNPGDGMVMVVNNTFRHFHDLMLQARAYDMTGKDTVITQWFVEISPSSVQKFFTVKKYTDKFFGVQGGFIDLRLLTDSQKVLSDNFYWYPDSTGNYSGLQTMTKAVIDVHAAKSDSNRIQVTLETQAGSPIAFFNRISLVDTTTRKRILPVFYSDNYVSVLPGEKKTVYIRFTPGEDIKTAEVSIHGWNVPERLVSIK